MPPITELFQQVPDEGEPATEKTEIWVTFDAENVYVTARCWDTAPPDRVDRQRLPARLVSDEAERHVRRLFDTFFDRRNGFVFYTNPLGARADYAVIDEGTNFDWNPVWDARPGRFEGGWTVEMQIPFKSLRYSSGEDSSGASSSGASCGARMNGPISRRCPQSAAGPRR